MESHEASHPWQIRMAHWGAAGSFFLLLLTGSGQLTFWGVYGLYSLPGLEWLENDTLSIVLHNLATLFLIAFMLFFWRFVKGKGLYRLWPLPDDLQKSQIYLRFIMGQQGNPPANEPILPSQRVAFACWSLLLLLMAITGVVKFLRHFWDGFAPSFLYVLTLIHNYGAVLLLGWLILHITFLIHPFNRKRIHRMIR